MITSVEQLTEDAVRHMKTNKQQKKVLKRNATFSNSKGWEIRPSITSTETNLINAIKRK